MRARRITEEAVVKRAVAFAQEPQDGRIEEPANQGKLSQDLLALILSWPESSQSGPVQVLGRKRSHPQRGPVEGQPVPGRPRGHWSVSACAGVKRGRQVYRREPTSLRAQSDRRERKTMPPLHFHFRLDPSQSPTSLCLVRCRRCSPAN